MDRNSRTVSPTSDRVRSASCRSGRVNAGASLARVRCVSSSAESTVEVARPAIEIGSKRVPTGTTARGAAAPDRTAPPPSPRPRPPCTTPDPRADGAHRPNASNDADHRAVLRGWRRATGERGTRPCPRQVRPTSEPEVRGATPTQQAKPRGQGGAPGAQRGRTTLTPGRRLLPLTVRASTVLVPRRRDGWRR